MSDLAERRAFQARERETIAEANPRFAAHLACERTCRACGCSDSLPCPEGCWWWSDGLCSACAQELEQS